MQSYCADSRVLRWRICECQRAEQKNEETLSAPTAHPREPQGWVGPVQLATPATHQERVCPGKALLGHASLAPQAVTAVRSWLFCF